MTRRILGRSDFFADFLRVGFVEFAGKMVGWCGVFVVTER
jgi:hypothetical protein